MPAENTEEPDARACPKCGSRHLMPDLPVFTQMYSDKVLVAAMPGVLLRSPRGVASVSATVCGACGHAEFHAAEHKQMWEVWRQHYT